MLELEHLLERRPVGGPHRVGDQPGREAGAPGRAAPRVGSRPCARGQVLAATCRPPPTATPGTRRASPCRSSAGGTCPCTGCVEQGAQVLVDVGLAGEAAEARGCRRGRASRSPYTGRMTASAIGRPQRVHDRRARRRRTGRCCRRRARGASRRTQSSSTSTTCASSAFGAGPVRSTWLTTGQTGARTSSVAARFITLTSSASVTLSGNWSNSSTRCTEPYGSSSPCMKPGADWLFQFSRSPLGPARVVRVLALREEARATRTGRCPSVGRRRSRPAGAHGQVARREVRRVPCGTRTPS